MSVLNVSYHAAPAPTQQPASPVPPATTYSGHSVRVPALLVIHPSMASVFNAHHHVRHVLVVLPPVYHVSRQHHSSYSVIVVYHHVPARLMPILSNMSAQIAVFHA